MSEIETIGKISELLEGLNQDARRRVMMYMADRFRILIKRCPTVSPRGFRSPGGGECFLPLGHNGPHQSHGMEWHDAKAADDE